MKRAEIRRNHLALTAAGAGLLAALLPIPVNVAYDPWTTHARAVPYQACWLERVELQYVRCDNLTGAGVRAPVWISQRP